ncbi:MAG: Fic family protein [Thiomicrorhabdus sp.]|jgi:Fic family protein|nr:Fic family protein [Thiomicrorhabdus sp.]
MNELTPFLPNPSSTRMPELLKKLESLHVSSQALCEGLHPFVLNEVKKSIILVNNYYSNFIESEGTHPADIVKAMQYEFSNNHDQQRKQRLALAYREAQLLILEEPLEIDYALDGKIKELHQTFYGSDSLLDEQRVVTDKHSNQHRIEPGEFRALNVEVGQHLAPPPEEIPRLFREFFAHYHYDDKDLRIKQLLKAFAAHHRYMYIHPFLDGNGRTGRLMTDGMIKQALPESYGLWSLSRGLARNNDRYKQFLARADQKRQGSSDGRGLLSESGLIEFIGFMTDIALDQANYMKGVLKLNKLQKRLRDYIAYTEQPIPQEFERMIPEFLIAGEIPKGELHNILGCSDRYARKIAKELKELGLIQDEGKFSSYKMMFTSEMLSFVFPDLIPFKEMV